MEDFREERILLEPVSPTGEFLNNSVLSVSILAVLEIEIPITIDISQATSLVCGVLLPINPRFSSIMVEDSNGNKKWQNVEVKFEDHLNFPNFPFGLSPESYDKYLDEYLSKMATAKFPQNKPLWEIHIVKYPTSKAAGNIIFKFHHALGDGYSLMGALLSSLQRAENPSLPLTFPTCQSSKLKRNRSIIHRLPQIFSSILYTIPDFGWSLIKSNFLKDDQSPIRSGNYVGVEFQPTILTTTTFSLDQVKLIKNKLVATINDVICGIIFFGARLYMQEINEESTNSNCTAIVLLNTRMFMDYASVNEMMKPDSKTPWGNRFAFLHIPIPKFRNDQFSNPLDIVRYAQKVIGRKRKSLSVYLNGRLLEMVKKFKGYEAAAELMYNTVTNASMVISNMIGPVEQMALANHPVKGLYFSLGGTPEDLNISIVSYMGKLSVTFGTKEGHIDLQKFKSCIEQAFDTIFKAAQNS
ncbi:wax ester synthase/diacylglycerol acyltransferase 4 [Ziziphus jujuba]|uniref:Wax ester synthase/diacylglycerol acyltransferase 4 n=1 Tax=Ziziphus jujuba TaxID=326968 RepID=A0ABM3IH12_ZIZJJ|nr:wax ester synthase/diacylglycerol acyltransferase 4 [Ziziphus jujuba]